MSKFQADFTQTFIDGDRWKTLIGCLGVTLKLTFFALILGVTLGVLIAVVRSTHDQLKQQHKSNAVLNILNTVCELYTTVIRGTPLMVQLLIMYFVIMASSTNTTLVATLSFGINSSAYVSEIIRGGIMSVDKGQTEAGRSLGLSYVQTMWFIVIPQALKSILPALGNEFIALLKETSIVNVIGMRDITKWAINVQGKTYQAFMPFLGVAAIYLVLVIVLTKLVNNMERRLNTDAEPKRKRDSH